MTIAEQIKTHRTSLGLTQEQLATRLHVSTPAVNKWEKGHSTPDVALLPALARLLEIDMNTLFDFNERLSEPEIALFVEELSEKVLAGDVEGAFAAVEAKHRDYPNCLSLLYQLALHLQACLLLQPNWSSEEKAPYQARITDWLMQVTEGEDATLANAARHMLALDYLDQGAFALAEEMIAALPKVSYDHDLLEGELLYRRGEREAAMTHIATGLFENLTKAMSQLYKLIDLEGQVGHVDTAHALADAASTLVDTFRFWPSYGRVVPQLMVALRTQDSADSLRLLRSALVATQAPCEAPILSYIPQAGMQESLSDTYRQSLIQEARTSAEYEFLRKNPDFLALLAEFES